MFNVKVIADSLNTATSYDGYYSRATTIEVTYPRIIHAEFCRHREQARNSASSRAIPLGKTIKAVSDSPFTPIDWQKEHKGMQGSDYFALEEKEDLNEQWLEAALYAVDKVSSFKGQGTTKQLPNRLLEPFMWHKEIITATEWENFFALRVSPHAEIHFQKIAKMILDAMNASVPRRLSDGEWHIPYEDKIFKYYRPIDIIKISTAMCAGVSYHTVNRDGSIASDDQLLSRTDKLLTDKHMSPTEHCLKAMSPSESFDHQRTYNTTYDENLIAKSWILEEGWCKQFRGFIPYRAMISEEVLKFPGLNKYKSNE